MQRTKNNAERRGSNLWYISLRAICNLRGDLGRRKSPLVTGKREAGWGRESLRISFNDFFHRNADRFRVGGGGCGGGGC